MPVRTYSVVGSSASGTANKTAAGVAATTAVRPAVSELMLGIPTAPNATDQQVQCLVGRFTAAGTSTAYTPLPVDPSDVAAVGIGGVAHSAEPTYTAGGTLAKITISQRGAFAWKAYEGREWKMPATAANGVGAYLSAVTAALATDWTVFFIE